MTRTTIYSHKKNLLVQASSLTTDGLWIASGPCSKLSEDCTDDELGAALQSTLRQSEQGVSHPTEWKSLLVPLLSAAGVKSWSTFARTAGCVQVAKRAERVDFVPTTNLGPKCGYEANEGKAVHLPLPTTPSAMGAALRSALERTE